MSGFEVLVPITFFLSIVYAIKAVVDARTRAKIIAANVSGDLLQSMIKADDQQRRQSSLRWGLVLVALGIAFALIQILDLPDSAPVAAALVVGATGVGNLVFYGMTKKEFTANASAA